ncbi:hypothetical protein ACFR99_06475 [Haloarchaeobius amylolyticus]|uniref:Uncharacterized protein n=1 Tax=Haloarchaeobius amylolyticus TaxID=1198296 RepID=A0ABD6BE16_9EURY
MKEVNRSILRLIASIASPAMIDDLELEPFVESDRGRDTYRESRTESPPSDGVDFEELRSVLRDVERNSLWSRFM